MSCRGLLQVPRRNESGLTTRDEDRVGIPLRFPRLLILCSPLLTQRTVPSGRGDKSFSNLLSRSIGRMGEVPIPLVGTRRETGGFDRHQFPHPPQEREVRELRPKRL